jgi:hypothetical protein
MSPINSQRPQPAGDPRRPVRAVRPPRPERPPVPQAVFIAPPVSNNHRDEDYEEPSQPPRFTGRDSKGLRMTRSATEAARRAGLDDDAIRRVMTEPAEIAPDRDHPDRTRFTRGPVVVVAAKDGMVLGVFKR